MKNFLQSITGGSCVSKLNTALRERDKFYAKLTALSEAVTKAEAEAETLRQRALATLAIEDAAAWGDARKRLESLRASANEISNASTGLLVGVLDKANVRPLLLDALAEVRDELLKKVNALAAEEKRRFKELGLEGDGEHPALTALRERASLLESHITSLNGQPGPEQWHGYLSTYLAALKA